MKKLERLIGQSEVKARLNDVIQAIKNGEKTGERYVIPRILLGGLTGLGKTFFADAFADALSWQFIEIPPQAGWRFFSEMALKSASINGETDAATPIPTVFLCDEAHDQKVLANMLKLVIGHDNPKMHERNGTKFFSDPAQHVWIFASNEELDPALRRRCGGFELILSPYNKGEKKELISLYSDKPIDPEALDYLEGRIKPTAGEAKNLCDALNVELVKKIDLVTAKAVVKKVGLFPGGIKRADLQILQRIAQGNAGLETLKCVACDVRTKTTKGRLGWLSSLNLCEPRKSAYVLTKNGSKYLLDLSEAQAKARAARK